MNDNLKKALENVYDEESARYLIGELTEFSPRFEREMDKLIGKKKSERSVSRKAFRIAVTAAACAAVLGIGLTAGAAATRGFTEKKGYSKLWGQEVMSLAAADAANSPRLIEQRYAPAAIPEGMELEERMSGMSASGKQFTVCYMYPLEDMLNKDAFFFMQSVRFTQYTKDEFSVTFKIPPYVEISKTSMNGCPAYIIREEHFYGDDVNLVWDSGDYIMSVSGQITVDQAKRIAESVAETDETFEEVPR